MNEFLYTTEYNGIPVRFHWSILLTLIFGVYSHTQTLFTVIAAFLSVIAIILVHEFGHYYMATRYRCRVFEIIVHYLGGYCTHEEPYYQYEDSMIALGGILAQGMLLITSLFTVFILTVLNINIPNLFHSLLIDMFVFYNLYIIVFNLIPFPGFDGHSAWKILRYFPKERIFKNSKSKKHLKTVKPDKQSKTAGSKQKMSRDEIKQYAEKFINDAINRAKEKDKIND